MSITPRIFLVIFLCSLSSLAYEITLTRIFSVSLWYHFAFMVISIAMRGIGASGTVLTLYPRLKNLSYIGLYSLLLGIGISMSYILSNLIPFDPVRLSWEKMQLFYISLSSIALIASFMVSNKWLKAVSLICIFLNLTLLLHLPSFVSLRMSPYKGLQVALKYPGAEHLKTYSSSFS